MQDPTVLRHRAKVRLVKDEALVQFLPVRVAVVEVTLADGTRLTERVDAVRGTPRNPMTRAEVVEKARDLIVPVLGTAKVEKLIDTVFALESLTNVRQLRPLLQAT
jgi:2-methylcitrate dehydratase PrpD